MNEKMYERFKQLCAESGNGNNSTDEEWGELACWIAPEMVEEITGLRAELAALREQTRWRRPDEKPEYGKWCLVRIGNTRHSVPAYLYEPDAVWRLWGSKISLEPHEVTKFLPLPEPPEDA